MMTDEEYVQYSDVVYRYLLSLTHDEGLAEELTQETFYQAVKSADRFDGSCKITTWLCAIAKNSLYKYARKNPGCAELDDEQTVGGSVEDDFLRRESYLVLLKRMHDLDENTKELMHLRLFGNLSFREIGEIMSKTENWARVTFFRTREKLKKEMSQNGE